jgi:hypothetical protein
MDIQQNPAKGLFQANTPVQAPSPVYPQIFSGSAELALSRQDFLRELNLVLERGTRRPLLSGTYIYSLRALDPAPFTANPLLRDLARGLPSPVVSNLTIGFLVHDGIYGQVAEAGLLPALLDAFVRTASRIEVKLRRRADDPEQTVVVNLV